MGKLSVKTKVMITLLIVVILCLLGLVVFRYMNNINLEDKACADSSEVDEKLCQVNTFKYDGENTNTAYGKVRVTGYAKVENVLEDTCDVEEDCVNQPKNKYVQFIITKTDSSDFKKYLKDLDDDNVNSIGLGCLKNNKIAYINNSVYFGDKDFELNEEIAEIITNSSKTNTITLDLEKLELGELKNKDVCYSHMTYIKVVK